MEDDLVEYENCDDRNHTSPNIAAIVEELELPIT